MQQTESLRQRDSPNRTASLARQYQRGAPRILPRTYEHYVRRAPVLQGQSPHDGGSLFSILDQGSEDVFRL